ncbi:MAG TPA: hypothetical protein VME23_01455 [Terracidiphilus sp.]|nr:hypothetical protein [Terracidiphilus sp.]
MAATTSQGKTFSFFMAAITVAAAGLAYVSTGAGKAALVIGLIGIVASFAGFLKIKPLEGRAEVSSEPTVLKLAGIACALGGWLIVLIGIHLSSSVGGRLATTLIGLAVTLAGVVGLLPAAARKNAFWKA